MADTKNTTWRDRLRHAFAVGATGAPLSQEDRAFIARLAGFIEARGLTAPAVAALEASRPYTFLGSQFLTFMKPFAHLALPGDDYDRFTRLMENRGNLDVILEELEQVNRGE